VNTINWYFTLKSINVEESDELDSILRQDDDVLNTSNSVSRIRFTHSQSLPQSDERSASLIASTKKSFI